MRLLVKENGLALPKHTDLMAAVAWSNNNELYTCGDDKMIVRWGADGTFKDTVASGIFATPKGATTPKSKTNGTDPTLLVHAVAFAPNPAGTTAASGELAAAGASDGRIYFCTKGLTRVEMAIEAHSSAVLCVQWDREGQALASGGEDGVVKVWSRGGMLRYLQQQQNAAVTSLAWSPDGSSVLCSCDRALAIKSTASGSRRPVEWTAHDRTVLQVDWSGASNRIVSCGADHRYKVWTPDGDLVYASGVHEHPVMSVAWAPSGTLFAAGSFQMVRLCDAQGWSHTLARPRGLGSLLQLAWSPDGAQLALGGSTGAVAVSAVAGLRLASGRYEATSLDDRRIRISDAASARVEEVEVPSVITAMAFGHGHLLVVTAAAQVLVFHENNWGTPVHCDMPSGASGLSGGRIVHVTPSSEGFLVAHTSAGLVHVLYSGRVQCVVKVANLRIESLLAQHVALSPQLIAVRDRSNSRVLRLLDAGSGRPLTEQPLECPGPVEQVGVAQGSAALISIVDSNGDLWLSPSAAPSWRRLAGNVSSARWSETGGMLAALVDGQLRVWLYPPAVYADADLLGAVRVACPGASTGDSSGGGDFAGPSVDLGAGAQLQSFAQHLCIVRRADGARVALRSQSELAALLLQTLRRREWACALRLCRLAKMRELWACLAAVAVESGELDAAEVAYAALDDIAKVEHICYIKSVSSAEGRAAELALFRRQPREAEAILLNANLIEAAVHMYLDLFQWERALQLAQRFQVAVSDVVATRAQHLRGMRQRETLAGFLALGSSDGLVGGMVGGDSSSSGTPRSLGRSPSGESF